MNQQKPTAMKTKPQVVKKIENHKITQAVKEHFNRPKGIRWMIKTVFIGGISASVILTAIVVAIFWQFSASLPQMISVADYKPLAVTKVFGAGGNESALMGEFYKERRYIVPYEKIPENVIRAFISAEDDRFFEHQGVNFAAIIRAAIANFRAGHVVQGGSTITQQVAKSLLLTPERNMLRKVKELVLANRIERNLTKQQILYLYLNQIYLGSGSYGVQAASLTYFHKDVSALSVAEAAILAGMPQAPGKYSPLLSPKKARERQHYVLRRMYENKYITQSQMTDAIQQSIRIYSQQDANKQECAYLLEHVRRYLIDKFGEEALYEDGLTVGLPTTPELCKSATQSLREGLRLVDKRGGYRGRVKKLKDIKEVEKFLTDQKEVLIEQRVGYQMLTADGRLDAAEAMKDSGITVVSGLLKQGELYQGVVTSVDDHKKSATVMVGPVKTEMPLEKMQWAKATVPSAVVSSGDVIWLKIEKNDATGVVSSLEQEPEIQGALFSIEALTGNVLAMVGGYNYEKSEFNRAIQAQRQPGSSFKPLIYSAGLEKGYTPASIIVDSPIVYQDVGFGKWKPSNFEEKFYGDTTFRQALIKSRNVPTIKIVQSVGVSYVIDFAKRLGMNAKFNADLSISLGSMGVSLFEMTKAYAVYARLGRKVEPVFINWVKDRDGRVLEEHKTEPLLMNAQLPVPQPSESATVSAKTDTDATNAASNTTGERASVVLPTYPLPNDQNQVMDPRVAYVMTHIMKEVVSYGTGHEAKNLGRISAGKTGTTNDYIDAWFMGFTPHVVTGVWVGFDGDKTIGHNETGAKAALPIWLNYMRDAVKPYPDQDFAVPPGVTFVSIDQNSGKLVSSQSSSAIREAFIEGTEPTEYYRGTGTMGPSNSSGGTKVTPSEVFKEDF